MAGPRRLRRWTDAAGSRGRASLETVLVLFFILILLVVAVDRFTSSVRAVRENALVVEVANLRSAVNFFTLLNKRLPNDLLELMSEKAVVPREDIHGAEYDVVVIGRYVESMTEDADGYPLDPFGNRYSFDPATGMVRPTTPGYESW